MLVRYRDELSVYEEFATTCRALIEQLLRHQGIRIHSVTCRAKTSDSLKDKLTRAQEQYQDLDEITDLAGIRIITYFSDEVDAIATIIEREFDVMPDKSIDKGKALDPDRFGYLSLHYVCTLPTKRTRLTEYTAYKGYVCEIQVRSILQHAWAEIEHDLGYKVAQGIPRHIRRRFSRLAGLLETGDDEFMRIRDELAQYASEVKKDIREKPEEVLLDKVSLSTFIEQENTVRRLDERLAAEMTAELVDPGDTFLEQIVQYLRNVGIDTIEQLRSTIIKRAELVLRQYQARFAGQTHDSLPRGVSLFQMWQVLLAETGDLKRMTAALDKFDVGSAKERQAEAIRLIEAVKKASDNQQ